MGSITSRKQSLLSTVVMVLAFFIYPVDAILEAAATCAEVKLQQVALFKNGLGFFVWEVACPDKKNSFSFVPAAAASHGTFWVSYPPKVNFESFIAKEIESEERLDAVNISELLKANVRSKVRLWFSGREDSTIEGVIKYFAEDRKPSTPNPYAPGAAGTATNRRGANFMWSRLVIIETDAGEVCIDPQNVTKVEFPEGGVEKTFASKSKSIQLDVKLRVPAGGQKLTVSYLAKGITWAPSYIVDITKSDKALVSAKAAVINEVCNLQDVTIQLVTGFPHLQFADVMSPLALKENLAQFLQALAKGQSERGRDGVMYNVMSQSAAGYRRGSRLDISMMPAYGAAETGKVAEDLFLYPVEKVNLPKDQVAYLPLFTESVPYTHIYQWKIPDYVSEEDRYSSRRRRGEQDQAKEEVWHCLRLKNTTKVPWTTAPAEIVKEGLILGQDTLNYTPTQAKTTLKITQAVSVRAEQMELETERERDAARLYGHHYDLVTLEGKLSVTNFQQKDITLEITKTLSGEVKSSQPQAQIETLAKGLRQMNSVRELTWTIELKPAESKQLAYMYEVYVRR